MTDSGGSTERIGSSDSGSSSCSSGKGDHYYVMIIEVCKKTRPWVVHGVILIKNTIWRGLMSPYLAGVAI